MFQDIKFPRGGVVKKFKGGPDSLKKIVALLRKKRFKGYLRFKARGNPDVGYIVMGHGQRVVALFSGSKGSLAGKDALPHFRDLAKNRDYTIEVHTDVDVEPILLSLPRGQSRGKGGRKSGVKEGGKAEDQARKGRSLKALGQSLANVIQALAEKGKDEKEEAKGAPATDAKRSRPRGKPAAKQPQKKDQAKAKTAGVGEAQKEKEKKASAARAERRRSPETAAYAKTGLMSGLTFERYFVGESNSFAHAACLAVTEGSSASHNPLFIAGTSGMGKTHLLNAIGNELIKRQGGTNLRYLTASLFRSELQRAEGEKSLAQFRDDFRRLDILILDDLQDIEGRARAQEEVLGIFDEFHAKGKTLVLAADRRPSEMDRLDPRLVSRFQSGLVVDLKPLSLDTRLEYLKDRLEGRGVSCSDEVLRYLAESDTPDLRMLDGTLNKVLAYASSLGEDVDLPLTREALGEVRERGGARSLPQQSLEVLPAHSYLVEEAKGRMAYLTFSGKAESTRGMLITRVNPARVREKYGMDGVEILWLTDKAESSEDAIEPVLERIVHTMEGFIVDGGPGILMLDGLDYLKSNHGFEPVLRFIRHVVDDVSESETTFLLALNPTTMPERELNVLEQEMEVMKP